MNAEARFAAADARHSLDRMRPAQARVTEAADAKATRTRRLLPAVLYLLFVLALLGALVVGGITYRTVAAQKADVDANRTALSLLSGYVRADDAAGAVGQGQGPEGPSLVLSESDQAGTYETRTGTPYAPDNATKVVDSSTFSFAYRNGLLTIDCDQGTATVALRSAQGGDRS